MTNPEMVLLLSVKLYHSSNVYSFVPNVADKACDRSRLAGGKTNSKSRDHYRQSCCPTASFP